MSNKANKNAMGYKGKPCGQAKCVRKYNVTQEIKIPTCLSQKAGEAKYKCKGVKGKNGVGEGEGKVWAKEGRQGRVGWGGGSGEGGR